MDNKGRFVVPRAVREALNLKAGHYFAAELEPDGDGFRVTRIEHPFDAMAGDAIREIDAGRTTNLRDVADQGLNGA
ncbi:MAG: AbrB/MazE/SpoVT family DNA-binding domain-containing protein [Chloroflexota bacterium]|nr:AbrB/MazE/SpoVT family DNA-binding domain-containing protein [Chloroflexota bacterium]